MFEGIIYSLKSLLKKPFKVGMITYYYPVDKANVNNGVAIHTSYLSKELAKLGCDVHIFTRAKKRGVKKEFFGDGRIVLHKINTGFDSPIKESAVKTRISYTIFDNQVINEITKENNHEQFDIIHTHGWLTAGAFISKHLNNIKWIHTFHALEKNRLKFMSKDEKNYSKVAKWVESTIKYADALVTVSKKLKIEVLQNYPVRAKKITVIPNGVDLSLFKTENIPQKDETILYIGRLSLEKGVDIFHKISKRILEQKKKTKFIMVASKRTIPSLEKIKNNFEELEKQYPKRFFWYKEELSREKIAELYKECTIFIQPSRYEAFGLTTLEAMACGKAVIVSNKGGLPEVVENAGIIIPLNSGLFIKNILRLLSDYRLRERYARRGIERAKLFEWDNIASKTLMLYKKIIGKLKKGEDKEGFW